MKTNFRKWSRTKPEEVYEKPLHSPKVPSGAALGPIESTGHIWRSWRKCTDGYNRHIEMLNMMFVNDIYPDQWFQQDGATAHTSLIAKEWLTNQFGNKIIFHHMEFPWPARSRSFSTRLFSMGLCEGERLQKTTSRYWNPKGNCSRSCIVYRTRCSACCWQISKNGLICV